MDRISVQIPGAPVGKQRPRGGRGRFYTPEETEAYERAVLWAVRAAMRAQGRTKPLEGPVVVALLALEPLPAGARTKRGALTALAMRCLKGLEPPRQRPDLDNIVKAVLDGTNGEAFADDQQVCGLITLRGYAERPRVELVIVPVEHPLGAAQALVYLAGRLLAGAFIR